MNEPLRQAAERANIWAGDLDRQATDADHQDLPHIAKMIRKYAEDLRTILAALAHPLLGGNLGSDPEDLSRSASGEEFLEFKEALDDIRRLRAEERALNGGGPGWAERNARAWAKADELFANDDETAWERQQEDAHR